MNANFFRAILPQPVKQGLKRLLGMPQSRIHPDWNILQALEPVTGEHVVIDLGARNGWFFHCWKKWCPKALIHAFEPDQAACEILKQRYKNDSTVCLNAVGVGDRQSTETFYHLAESEVSSSFLQHDQKVWDDIKYRTGQVQERQVKITTLDDYCDQHAIADVHLIKIDIQGYELKALQGALQTLTKTNYLLVESSIRPLYKDSARFTEVHDFLVSHGFHLMNLRAWHRGNHVLMETDMLFRKNELAPAVDADAAVDRYYIGQA